jgi:hypothetical protein
LPNSDDLDQTGKPKHCREQSRHDYFGDHHYTVILSP